VASNLDVAKLYLNVFLDTSDVNNQVTKSSTMYNHVDKSNTCTYQV
jgi:hypothetical protein